MTRTGEAGRPPLAEEKAETFFDWLRLHSRIALLLAIVVVAIAGGVYMYREYRLSQELTAERSLNRALQAFSQGNMALAQADLQRLVTRFEKTPAAVQGALLLAQIHYQQGEHEQGIKALEQIRDERAARPMRGAITGLIADGYEEQRKFVEAAERYQAAAEAARFDAERALFMADAARAYQSAGNAEAARKIWAELAEDDSGPVAGEARVRLGELTAAAASRT